MRAALCCPGGAPRLTPSPRLSLSALPLTGVGSEKATWLASTAPAPGETRMCTKQGVRCEPAFEFKGKTYFGCTSDHHIGGQPWCFTDEARGIWSLCANTCAHAPGGGFPGHFTSAGNLLSRVGGALRAIFALLVIVGVAGACVYALNWLRGRLSGGGGGGRERLFAACVPPVSLGDAHEACEGAAEWCARFVRRQRDAATATSQRARANVSEGGGLAGGASSGYARNLASDDGELGGRQGGGVAMADRSPYAEGGVRSSVAPRGASAFHTFQAEDDML